MATIDVGMTGHRRDPNRELALIPFIDFLLCLVAFLLVTAVWSSQARVPADASVPGERSCCNPPEKSKALHVTVREQKFELSWRQGATVVASQDVPKKAIRDGQGDVRYPELAKAVAEEWRAHGTHRSTSEGNRDRAVLHTPNSLAHADVIGVLDAIGSTSRSRGARPDPAFAVTFAVD